jgi:hypothetical protein
MVVPFVTEGLSGQEEYEKAPPHVPRRLTEEAAAASSPLSDRGGPQPVQVAAQITPNLGGAYITTNDLPQRKISRRIALC